MEKRSLQNIDQLNGLLATLDYQEQVKKDYVASTGHLQFLNGNLIVLKEGKSITYQPTKVFHSQMQEKLGIPAGYYNKILDGARKLLDENVNHWLHAEGKNLLVRTFEDGAKEFNSARALLSDRYNIIDNYQVLMQTLETIKATGLNVEIVNAELSEKRMYLKVVCPDVEIQATEMLKEYRLAHQRGSGIISGFTLSNSEVGGGAFNIVPRAVVLACQNGMVITEDKLRNIHLGAKMDELGFGKNKAVVDANMKLIREQVKHAVNTFLSKDYLQKVVNTYTELGDKKIEAPVDKVIEVVAKNFQITEDRRANLLKYFIEGGDTRRMGVASAMTRECQDLADADLKHDTEVAAFQVLQDFGKIEAEAKKLSAN